MTETVPCSAWCRPDDDVHVILVGSNQPSAQVNLWQGHLLEAQTDGCFGPKGTQVCILSAEDATEISREHALALTGISIEETNNYPFIVLLTVQVSP